MAPKYDKLKIYNMKKIILVVLCIYTVTTFSQTTVTYTMQDAYFPTQFNDGGDFFDNVGTELGMWANNGNKNTVAWRTFKIDGLNAGSDRALQVGDVFTITVSATRAFGQIGFSLNAGGTSGSSYENRVSGSRLYCNTDDYGAWYINNSSGNTVLGAGYSPIENTYKNYIFTIKITSSTTVDAYLTVDGTDYRAYNLEMNGTSQIDAFSVYGSDMWDGSSNDNAYWKQSSSVTNSKVVELGYFLSTGSYTPGLVSDGLDASSASTSSINSVFIGGDAGTSVILDQTNTYTGTTSVNSNAKLLLGASGVIPDASAVTVTGTFDMAGYSETMGSLAGTGLVTCSSSGTPTLTVGGDNTSTTYSGVIENGSATSVGLTKTGSGTLTLSGTNTYSGSTTVSSGTLQLEGNISASNVSVSSGGALVINGDVTINNLTVVLGGTVEVLSGGSLTVAGSVHEVLGSTIIRSGGAMTINGADSETWSLFTIENDAELTINGSAAIFGSSFTIESNSSGTGSLIANGTTSGTISVERYIGAWSDASHGWHLLSSPVGSQSIQKVVQLHGIQVLMTILD